MATSHKALSGINPKVLKMLRDLGYTNTEILKAAKAAYAGIPGFNAIAITYLFGGIEPVAVTNFMSGLLGEAESAETKFVKAHAAAAQKKTKAQDPDSLWDWNRDKARPLERRGLRNISLKDIRDLDAVGNIPKIAKMSGRSELQVTQAIRDLISTELYHHRYAMLELPSWQVVTGSSANLLLQVPIEELVGPDVQGGPLYHGRMRPEARKDKPAKNLPLSAAERFNPEAPPRAGGARGSVIFSGTQDQALDRLSFIAKNPTLPSPSSFSKIPEGGLSPDSKEVRAAMDPVSRKVLAAILGGRKDFERYRGGDISVFSPEVHRSLQKLEGELPPGALMPKTPGAIAADERYKVLYGKNLVKEDLGLLFKSPGLKPVKKAGSKYRELAGKAPGAIFRGGVPEPRILGGPDPSLVSDADLNELVKESAGRKALRTLGIDAVKASNFGEGLARGRGNYQTAILRERALMGPFKRVPPNLLALLIGLGILGVSALGGAHKQSSGSEEAV